MSTKLLVTLQDPDDARTVRESGIEILAEYPDSMLVRGTDEQARSLAVRGIEAIELPEQAVQVTGISFSFEDAVRAQEAVPLSPGPGRTAYYLIKLVGPPAAEWVRDLQSRGVVIHGTLPGFTLLVGVLPERVAELRAFPWVEAVTPYRPAMKVSPMLHSARRRDLDSDALTRLAAEELAEQPQLIEVAVFPGESINDVAARVRETGGTVLSTLPRSLVANVPAAAIAELAELPGTQAILPYAVPELHNDQARVIMRVPVDNSFADVTLKGTNQIIGIADSGLDTGDPTTVHVDVRDRVIGLVSWPTNVFYAAFTTDPPASDDGPADRSSGHGTHVTGSVLGNGAAAVGAGAAAVPAGTAPDAKVFFQAVDQQVKWKSAAQLEAEHLQPFQASWPPAATGLYGLPDDISALLDQAYRAGARIHTNSWGSSKPTLAGVYSAMAVAVDDFMWNHPDMFVLFSAGNAGVDTDADGVIDPDSIGPPGTAKNCLTVGASENNRPRGSLPPPGVDAKWTELGVGGVLAWPHLGPAGHVSDNVDGMAAFSSRGPTDDGRIKPDVVAPGTNVLSVLSSVFPPDKKPLHGRLPAGHPLRPFYCWSGGTSMATPLVAGAAALIRQEVVERRDHAQPNRKPSGALIKAILINGAVTMPGQFPGEIPAGPNPVSGFGRVDVVRSLGTEPLQRTLFADEPDDSVATGEMRVYEVQAMDPAAPLKVTLVWTDAPGLVGTGGLVNRLYLQVQAPDGGITDGDVGVFPAATNNVQQARVAAPTAGTYRIRVRGVAVTVQAPGASTGVNPRQNFAVAISNATNMSVQPVGAARSVKLPESTVGSAAIANTTPTST